MPSAARPGVRRLRAAPPPRFGIRVEVQGILRPAGRGGTTMGQCLGLSGCLTKFQTAAPRRIAEPGAGRQCAAQMEQRSQAENRRERRPPPEARCSPPPTSFPTLSKAALLLFRMLSQGRCGRSWLSGKPRSSGRQRAQRKNASRTPVTDSGTHHSTAGRRGWAGRRAPSAGGGALWAPHPAAGGRRHDHPRRPSTKRS